MVRLLVGAVSASILASSAGADVGSARRPLVSLNSYASCDGFGEAKPKDDGLKTYAPATLFAFRPDRMRVATPFGQAGLFACDAAIGRVAEDYPGHRLRMVSLLRGRAMHKLALDDTRGALADLDSADTITFPGDPRYARSLKLSLELVRSLALRRSGDQAAAEAAAWRAWSARPYDYRLTVATAVVLGPDADFGKLRPVLVRQTQLDPRAGGSLFRATFERGGYQDAVALTDGLLPRMVPRDEPASAESVAAADEADRVLAEEFWADTLGRKAFALAALGRGAEARATLAEAQNRFANATPAFAKADPKGSDKKAAVLHEQANARLKQSIPAALAEWALLTQAQLLAHAGKPAEALRALSDPQARLPRSRAALATLELLNADGAAIAGLRNTLHQGEQTAITTDLATLFFALPQAETESTAPRYSPMGLGFLSANGYEERAPRDRPAALNISFTGLVTSLPALEEAALLRAADVARRQGHTAIRIAGRKDIEHTTMVRTGAGMVTYLAGYESCLEVEFVDAATIAPADRWRLLDATSVYEALAPSYLVKPKER